MKQTITDYETKIQDLSEKLTSAEDKLEEHKAKFKEIAPEDTGMETIL